MKALSIRQPWAWLIVNGYKDIENRTWPTRIRGRIYVLAPKLPDPGWFPSLAAEVRSREIDVPANLALGALVGEVDIVGCVTESTSPWFAGPYGFILSNPLAYQAPVPCRGRLGFFEVALPQITR